MRVKREMITTVPIKTRRHLEWDQLCAALAELCQGEEARARALSLSPLSDRAVLQLRLEEVDEARALIDEGERLPLGLPKPIERSLSRAGRGGTLSAEALVELGAQLEAAWRCRRLQR